jgi:hypothetical protein
MYIFSTFLPFHYLNNVLLLCDYTQTNWCNSDLRIFSSMLSDCCAQGYIVLEGPRQKAWILSFSVPNFLLLHFIGYCFSGVFWLGWSARMYCNMRWSIYALVYKNMITCKCISGLHNWRRWNSERVFGDFRGISTLHASKRIFSNNFWSIQ